MPFRLSITASLVFLTACVAFTRDKFPSWTDLSDFEREWYSKHLIAARERPLFPQTDSRTIRLTWLRTFHNPIVVRIDCAEECAVNAVRLSGAGGYKPGHIAEKTSYILTPTSAEALQDQVADARDYQSPENIEFVVLDGARWILELSENGDYKAWTTYGPGLVSNEAFSKLLYTLVEMSKFEIAEGETY
ncbi:MAG: hypothetical protein AAGH76_08845 [Pseudomonadota bacterium]